MIINWRSTQVASLDGASLFARMMTSGLSLAKNETMSFTINQLTRPVDLLQADYHFFTLSPTRVRRANYPTDGPAACGETLASGTRASRSDKPIRHPEGRTLVASNGRTTTVRQEGTLGFTTLSVPEPRSVNCAQCRPIPLQATNRHQPREYAADSLFCYRKSLASIKANKIKTG